MNKNITLLNETVHSDLTALSSQLSGYVFDDTIEFRSIDISKINFNEIKNEELFSGGIKDLKDLSKLGTKLKQLIPIPFMKSFHQKYLNGNPNNLVPFFLCAKVFFKDHAFINDNTKNISIAAGDFAGKRYLALYICNINEKYFFLQIIPDTSSDTHVKYAFKKIYTIQNSTNDIFDNYLSELIILIKNKNELDKVVIWLDKNNGIPQNPSNGNNIKVPNQYTNTEEPKIRLDEDGISVYFGKSNSMTSVYNKNNISYITPGIKKLAKHGKLNLFIPRCWARSAITSLLKKFTTEERATEITNTTMKGGSIALWPAILAGLSLGGLPGILAGATITGLGSTLGAITDSTKGKNMIKKLGDKKGGGRNWFGHITDFIGRKFGKKENRESINNSFYQSTFKIFNICIHYNIFSALISFILSYFKADPAKAKEIEENAKDIEKYFKEEEGYKQEWIEQNSFKNKIIDLITEYGRKLLIPIFLFIGKHTLNAEIFSQIEENVDDAPILNLISSIAKDNQILWIGSEVLAGTGLIGVGYWLVKRILIINKSIDYKNEFISNLPFFIAGNNSILYKTVQFTDDIDFYSHISNIKDNNNNLFMQIINNCNSNIIFYIFPFGSYTLLGFTNKSKFLNICINQDIINKFNSYDNQGFSIRKLIETIFASLKMNLMKRRKTIGLYSDNSINPQKVFLGILENPNNKQFEKYCAIFEKKPEFGIIYYNNALELNKKNNIKYPIIIDAIPDTLKFDDKNYGFILDNTNKINLIFTKNNPEKAPNTIKTQTFEDNDESFGDTLKFYGGAAGLGLGALALSSSVYKEYISEFISAHPTLGPILSPILNNPKLSATAITLLLAKHKWIFNMFRKFILGKKEEENA